MFTQIGFLCDRRDGCIRAELVLCTADVLHGLLQVDRHPNGLPVVVQVAAVGLVEPVNGIGTEQQSAAPVEAIDGPEQRG